MVGLPHTKVHFYYCHDIQSLLDASEDELVELECKLWVYRRRNRSETMSVQGLLVVFHYWVDFALAADVSLVGIHCDLERVGSLH